MNRALLFAVVAIALSVTTFYFNPFGLLVTLLPMIFAFVSIIIGIIQITKKIGSLLYNIIAILLDILLIGYFVWIFAMAFMYG